MKAIKYKHLSFEDRCVIEEFLNHNFNFTQIAYRIGKSRRTISIDVKKHRYLRTTNSCNNQPCCFENKPPYVCNGCPKFNNCRRIRYSYSHDIAYNEYKQNLINSRANLRITKDDFRDYFRATSSINDARINSISILTAWYISGAGYKWYQDIIPLTQLNIPNEALIDLTKGIDITYHIYF